MLIEEKGRFITELNRKIDGLNTISLDVRLSTLLIIVVVGVFYISTIRSGHYWGDDFSLYISHARNIVEGRPYADTGYIYNPHNVIAPRAYPPVYPLLIAPVYKLWGLNLTAMKVEIILIFLLALFVIYLTFQSELQWPYLPALIALIGFNPQFWLFKDNVISDLPFLLFIYLSFYLIHEAYQQAYRPNRTLVFKIIYALSISVSIFLASGTRSIGLVLIPCLLVYHFVRSKRAGLFGLSIILLTVAFIFVQAKSSNFISAYVDHFRFNNMNIVVSRAHEMAEHLAGFWTNGSNKVTPLALLVILTVMAVAGYLARIWKKQLACFDLFVPLYLAPFIVLPVRLESRYMVPIIPLWLFYTFLGIQTISRLRTTQRQVVEKVAFSGLLLALLVSYSYQYATMDYGPIQKGIAKNETQQLFDYVKREVGEKEVVVFCRPKALSLFSGRSSAIWHAPAEDEELWKFFRQINASYLIVGPEELDPYYQQYIRKFVEKHHDRFQETFANADFRVYRIVRVTS
jgi:hypothetical protein